MVRVLRVALSLGAWLMLDSKAIKFTDISLPPNRQIMVFVDLSVDPPPANSCSVPPGSDNVLTTGKLLSDQEVFVYVAVQDSGPGLKPGDLALLFQRFQQGSFPFLDNDSRLITLPPSRKQLPRGVWRKRTGPVRQPEAVRADGREH